MWDILFSYLIILFNTIVSCAFDLLFTSSYCSFIYLYTYIFYSFKQFIVILSPVFPQKTVAGAIAVVSHTRLHSTNTIVKFADDTTVVGLIQNDDESADRELCRLGTHITQELTWTLNITALVKKAQQRLCFLRTLKKNELVAAASPVFLSQFCREHYHLWHVGVVW